MSFGIVFHPPQYAQRKFLVSHLVNWPTPPDFANLEELCVNVQTDGRHPISHPLLRLVTSPRLRQVIVEVGGGTKGIQWLSLDQDLVNLVERHKVYCNLELQILTIADPEKVRGLLPQAAEGILEVRSSERSDYWV